MTLIFPMLVLIFLYLFHISKSRLFSLIFLALTFFSISEWIYLGSFELVSQNYSYDIITNQLKQVTYNYDFVPFEKLYSIANGFLYLGYAIIVVALVNEVFKLFTGKYLI